MDEIDRLGAKLLASAVALDDLFTSLQHQAFRGELVDMTNFTFLQRSGTVLYEAAAKAESLVNGDARACRFYARRCLEITVAWLYKNDKSLRLPYQDQLNALMHEPTSGRQSARRYSQKRG